MWYLIIPPIIVIASLSLVLWYLSRKGANPLIAEKALQLGEEAVEQISFLRTKTFALRLLEKTAYRFKVVSLQLHNALHNLTQSLKERQRSFKEKPSAAESAEALPISEQAPVTRERGFFRQLAGTKSGLTGIAPEAPQAVPPRMADEVPQPVTRTFPEAAMDQSEVVLRPMVSETAAHPETPRQRTQAEIAREENLIARIAVNPKDFVAYEGLGDYYLEIGNIRDAKECYRQVLKLSPAHRMVRIKIRRLEKIVSQGV
ncbi:MAG: hypothetical protein A2878_01585 [Candidatus Moranbacteria bacterium RIFCSPHIGHO2_01_FULL_54_31]|nr:MAG: hypothetical protein A2878_01585 [Candidatus Moranbacteria bacterium RIFCSPHIGHO2_01_FULL_54_31]